MLLEVWKDFEAEFGSGGDGERVAKLLPEKVKKRRKLTAEDGVRRPLDCQQTLEAFQSGMFFFDVLSAFVFSLRR